MRFRSLIALLVLSALHGCSDEPEVARGSGQSPVEGSEPCSAPWYEEVETRFPTGDGRGHGPDIGSQEWKSVVEFKMGIRGDPGMPDATSEAWCRFIDQRIRMGR